MLNKEAVESEANGPGEMDIRTLGSTRPINCASGVISGAQSSVQIQIDLPSRPERGDLLFLFLSTIVTIMVSSRCTKLRHSSQGSGMFVKFDKIWLFIDLGGRAKRGVGLGKRTV
jgi:hypothetical protein